MSRRIASEAMWLHRPRRRHAVTSGPSHAHKDYYCYYYYCYSTREAERRSASAHRDWLSVILQPSAYRPISLFTGRGDVFGSRTFSMWHSPNVLASMVLLSPVFLFVIPEWEPQMLQDRAPLPTMLGISMRNPMWQYRILLSYFRPTILTAVYSMDSANFYDNQKPVYIIPLHC